MADAHGLFTFSGWAAAFDIASCCGFIRDIAAGLVVSGNSTRSSNSGPFETRRVGDMIALRAGGERQSLFLAFVVIKLLRGPTALLPSALTPRRLRGDCTEARFFLAARLNRWESSIVRNMLSG